jgi:XisH protein
MEFAASTPSSGEPSGILQVARDEGSLVPARDRYHDTVVRALTKDGWTVTAQQVAVAVPGRRLWIDLRATKARDSLVVLIEVKGFEMMPSPVDYLAAAVGQYVLYRAA